MTPELRLEVAAPAHLVELALDIRPDDLLEVLDSGHPSALAALEASVADSDEAFTLFIAGRVAAVFGTAVLDGPVLERADVRAVWMLSGLQVELHRLSFYRASKLLLADLLARYSQLLAFVDTRYQRALEWIEVLGGRLEAVRPHPLSGRPFQVVSFGGA